MGIEYKHSVQLDNPFLPPITGKIKSEYFHFKKNSNPSSEFYGFTLWCFLLAAILKVAFSKSGLLLCKYKLKYLIVESAGAIFSNLLAASHYL